MVDRKILRRGRRSSSQFPRTRRFSWRTGWRPGGSERTSWTAAPHGRRPRVSHCYHSAHLRRLALERLHYGLTSARRRGGRDHSTGSPPSMTSTAHDRAVSTPRPSSRRSASTTSPRLARWGLSTHRRPSRAVPSALGVMPGGVNSPVRAMLDGRDRSHRRARGPTLGTWTGNRYARLGGVSPGAR